LDLCCAVETQQAAAAAAAATNTAAAAAAIAAALRIAVSRNDRQSKSVGHLMRAPAAESWTSVEPQQAAAAVQQV
jgi:hypothetical protein